VRQQKQTITFRSAAEMLDSFGLLQGGSQYRRLIASFQRIFGATIFFGTDTQREKAAVFDQNRFHFMKEARLWHFQDSDQGLTAECQNRIVLSEEFFREILNHPIPADLEAAKALSSSPAALDLFLWPSYRCFTAKGPEHVSLFGTILSLNWAALSMPVPASSASAWSAGWNWYRLCGRIALPGSAPMVNASGSNPPSPWQRNKP